MDIKRTEYVIIDVETTGLNVKEGDRIIEIAAVKIKNYKVTDRFESFINPQRELSIGAQKINNITYEMVETAPTAAEVLPMLIDFIAGACLVAHNAKFDLDFLCYELSLIGRKLNEATPVLDTIKLARAFLPYLNSYRLSYVAHSLGLSVEETHRALVDASLTASVLIRLLEMTGKKGVSSFQDLCGQFSIPKPNFKIEEVEQGFLF